MNKLSINFSQSAQQLPPKLRGWLLHNASFIERLKQHGVLAPRIQVLKQCWRLPLVKERKYLRLKVGESALIREVLITNENKQWMFARTIFPRGTLTGKLRRLAHLKNRSLGTILFKDPWLKRSNFDIVHLLPEMLWHKKVSAYAQRHFPDLWARYSLFNLQGKELLLMEVFLPDVETL